MSSIAMHIWGQSSARAMKILIVISVLFISVSQATVGRQNDVSARVSQVVALLPNEPKLARKHLLALGPSAFPYVLRIVREDAGLGMIKKTFLIDVIARSKTKQSGSALIELLTDTDPYVRGLAASYVDKRRYRAAVPHLIKLLDDKGVYVTQLQTDPERHEPVLVRDKVMEALQGITGRTMDTRSTQDERAAAWVRWWEKQQRSK